MDVTLHLAQDPEADEFLGRSALAALVGMLLDQQVPMEWAFKGPSTIARRMGAEDLDAHDIAAHDPDAFAALLSDKPAVHRYPGSMAGRVQELCRYLVTTHDGDAEAVWRGVDTGGELLKRLQELPGFGKQKAQIFLALLGKQLGVQPAGLARGRRRLRRTRFVPLRRRHHRTGVPDEGARPQTGDEGGGEGGEGLRRVAAAPRAGPLRPGTPRSLRPAPVLPRPAQSPTTTLPFRPFCGIFSDAALRRHGCARNVLAGRLSV